MRPYIYVLATHQYQYKACAMLGIWYPCRNRCQKWMQPLPLPHLNQDDSQMVFTADRGFQKLIIYSGLFSFKSRNQEQLANLSKPIRSHSRMRRNVFDSDPTLRLILSTDHVARFFNLSFVICQLRGVINRWSFHHYNLSHNMSVSSKSLNMYNNDFHNWCTPFILH